MIQRCERSSRPVRLVRTGNDELARSGAVLGAGPRSDPVGPAQARESPSGAPRRVVDVADGQLTRRGGYRRRRSR